MTTTRYIRTILILFALLFGMTGGAWADLTVGNITIQVEPGSGAGTVTATSVSGREVTLTVTPASGYYIRVADIVVEPLAGMDGANARRRTPGFADQIEGKMYQGDAEKSSVVYPNTATYKFTLPERYDGAYVTATFKTSTAIIVTSSTPIGDNPDMSAHYILVDDVNESAIAKLFTASQTTAFSGTFEGEAKADGTFPQITGLTHALFDKIDGGTVNNVMLESVSVSGGTNAGAICNEATGAARIYNCGILSGSVGGSGDVGGLVGSLDGTARVINCFSYATITGGSVVGGIVGNNKGTTKAGSINTMVMNCMFYGDITGGTTVSPVYGGNNIGNLAHDSDRTQDGLNTFNYYAYDKLKTKAISNNKYNSTLAAEERYLNRFEFYRLLLNSNKKLAAFYITGSASDANLLAKWVLETADRSITGRDPYPYPILKAQGRYPSIINPDFDNAPDSAFVGRNHGGKLGKTLNITISNSKTDGGQSWPKGARVTTTRIALPRTDKDFDRFNFNYDKVQLPYYNDVGIGNYTGNRVVTGWKITAITAIPGDPYTASNYPTSGVKDYPDHNYADRKSSNKDLYTVSKRVFSQGAYFDVPYGVTSITIEPYWGVATYIADANYDVVYKNNYTGKQNVSQTGTQVGSGAKFNSQTIYTSISNNLLNALTGPTVYDNAMVLVGNFHLDNTPLNGTKPFTIMSVDTDKDNEPDYCLIYHHKNRTNVTPIRFDFLAVPGTAQAQKPNGASLVCNFTIFKMRGWFEVTNTAFMYSNQLEYENGELGEGVTKMDAPLILFGGIFDQFVSTQKSAVNGKTIYIHLGGNLWIDQFGLGTHSDGSQSTPHVPVSVSGGEYNGFYLTGTYNPNATVKDDNAECYISGGHFKEVAGACQEQLGATADNGRKGGDVHWQIYNADIDEFFGGGINDAKPVKGNITTDIYNSHVTTFCGGPKFGNMSTGKTVTTTAEGCVFGTYFGAGYGGNSYSRKKYYDHSSYNWNTLQGYYTTDRGLYFDGSSTNSKQPGGASGSLDQYGKKGPGVAVDFDHEFFVWSSGTAGARFFVKFVSFSLAQCEDVSSTLKRCTIEGNFYGGGSLGKVSGTATSELEDCEVRGDAFGAGYSATLPKIPVRKAGFTTNPEFKSASGIFDMGVKSGTDNYEWKHKGSYPSNGTVGFIGDDDNYNINGTNVVTDVDISSTNLGSVGSAELTLKGNTTVARDVFGGGDASAVNGVSPLGNATVILQGNTHVGGNVYGGGNHGMVSGSTKVEIKE